jgi:hypothetical protein
MRNVFIRIVMVEDTWVNYFLQGRFDDWVDQDFDDYFDKATLKVYMKRVHGAPKNTCVNLELQT